MSSADLGTGTWSYLRDPGSALRPARIEPQVAGAQPLVSCIMASRGEYSPARFAIACFQGQTYASRELVIATTAADDHLADYVARLGDPRIRIVHVPAPARPGKLRNIAIEACSGALICGWDDDDLSHPERIALQVGRLQAAEASACFLARLLLWWPGRRIAVSGARIWENTILARRSALPPYPEDFAPGEDTFLVRQLQQSERLILADVPEAYCYVAHGTNLVGAAHFEMLLAGATRTFEGADYHAVIAARASLMPFADYAAHLSRS